MFVDASALVAVLTGEPEGQSLTDRLEAADDAFTSPLAVYEATVAIRRKLHRPLAVIQADISAFLQTTGMRLVPIPPVAGERALAAFERYGKGTGHPARLNMGDCFAYAMAEIHGVPLLFKGDDFAMTEIGQSN
ncbi:MAG: type II toxin-antitoxin system VapC family toxin [Methylobacterium sp.]|uniref:type II toxin-antitoxin system VapC family toxin n=1 Tax=Methylobacterium sp. TaxID=409 RepID=UPI0025EF5C9C|nr:type II toxin-antitoxin system VapC family toxin [Methylobacterium sp.]MBX9934454.1 type II toxin-antitoxin system VapC family toxin [Methylobacterium sp.]